MPSDCGKHPEKWRFPSYEHADNALGRIWRRGRRKVLPSRIYFCDSEIGGCDGFHHTKKPKHQKERTER